MVTSLITATSNVVTITKRADMSLPTLSSTANSITSSHTAASITSSHTAASTTSSTGSSSTTSYTYSVDIDDLLAVDNPYIEKSTLPTNLVFIIIGSTILLIILLFLLFWVVASILSWKRAKHQSEKYYYNLPFSYESSSSASSSFHEKMSRNTVYTNLDNASMLSLNQPLGRSYRNSTLDNTRMSMFISPTNELLNYTDSSVNVSSNVSFIQLNESVDEKINLLSEEPVVKSKRPPSQYLEDLLGDKENDFDTSPAS